MSWFFLKQLHNEIECRHPVIKPEQSDCRNPDIANWTVKWVGLGPYIGCILRKWFWQKIFLLPSFLLITVRQVMSSLSQSVPLHLEPSIPGM